jgi:hypothetical protein
MNPTDLRAELLNKAKYNYQFFGLIQHEQAYDCMADFALPYAEQVAELQQQLAASQQRDWISVKDRLPDDATCVLIYCESSEQGCKQTVALYGKYEGWFPDDEGLQNISHWQPLPPAPEDKTERK